MRTFLNGRAKYLREHRILDIGILLLNNKYYLKSNEDGMSEENTKKSSQKLYCVENPLSKASRTAKKKYQYLFRRSSIFLQGGAKTRSKADFWRRGHIEIYNRNLRTKHLLISEGHCRTIGVESLIRIKTVDGFQFRKGSVLENKAS